MDVKSTVWHYLKNAREQVLWKVEGLPERDQKGACGDGRQAAVACDHGVLHANTCGG